MINNKIRASFSFIIDFLSYIRVKNKDKWWFLRNPFYDGKQADDEFM